MTDMDYEAQRLHMVSSQIQARGIHSSRLLEAMRRVERHRFVPENLRDAAYRDGPLPIGEGQTISQPYMVASMTEELELQGDERVLEIGTGSGYQTAVLALLSQQVFTIERHQVLADSARNLFVQLGYTNIDSRVADGTHGWPEKAPFDAILVTAGAPGIPSALREQLAEGGRLVIPVGDRFTQVVEIHRKTRSGFSVTKSTPCRFVRLIGTNGWDC